MKGMILFLTLLGANVITNGAPATDHNAKVTMKRDIDCYVQMEECEESQSVEECEKEVIECLLAYFTKDEISKVSKRFCSLPAFCGGAKKRHSELKRHGSCFEDFVECEHEKEEEAEAIPSVDLNECESEIALCVIDEHIDTYPKLLEEGKAFCELFREQFSGVPGDCDEELVECLEKAEDNDIAVAACETNKIECELESAR